MQKINISPFQIIGISIRTTNEQAGTDMAKLWESFMSENILEKIPNKIDDHVYSLYTDYEGDHTKPYTAILGAKVKKLDRIPENMISKVCEGGSYLKSSARGDITKGMVSQKWAEIRGMEIDRAYTADFEVYGEKAENPQDAEVDFLIALKEFKPKS